MNLSLGNAIAVSTNFIKSNPAVPVYNGEQTPENLYAVIYHIEIGYNQGASQELKQYIIIDYKEFDLSIDSKNQLIEVAKEYCAAKNIEEDNNLEIALLDNEEAENFLEKDLKVIIERIDEIYRDKFEQSFKVIALIKNLTIEEIPIDDIKEFILDEVWIENLEKDNIDVMFIKGAASK